jgi:hypothetical protein
MSRIVAIKTRLNLSGAILLQPEELKKICAYVDRQMEGCDNFDIVLGRWGTNKAALRKLLVKK